MLDGKRYFAAFPDENPEMRLRMQTLGVLLKKLETEFRQHIEPFRISQVDNNKPGFQARYRNSNHRV
jgi:hypothetical protein